MTKKMRFECSSKLSECNVQLTAGLADCARVVSNIGHSFENFPNLVEVFVRIAPTVQKKPRNKILPAAISLWIVEVYHEFFRIAVYIVMSQIHLKLLL